MAIYSQTNNSIQLDGFHAYAQYRVRKGLEASQYNRTVIFDLLMGRGRTGGKLGRPGNGLILGSAAGLSQARRESMTGDSGYKIRILTAQSDGGRHIGARDTTPAVDRSQDQNVSTAEVRYAKYDQPIKVWNTTLELADGNEIANATDEAIEQANETLMRKISAFLYLGSPTSQSADLWDSPQGLVDMCNTTNTYLNVDRSTTTMWAGRRVTTAVAAKLSLIDDANLIQGAATNGPGVNTVLCSMTNYNRFKQEALARGGTLITGALPEAAKVGIRKEAVVYGGVTIVGDPFIKSYSSDTDLPSALRADISNYVFMLNMDSIYVTIHGGGNFRVSKWVDQGEQAPGGDDAMTSKIRLMYRLFSPRPWEHVLYTGVSA